MTNHIKILLADDHEVVRDGFRQSVNETDDLTVVGEAVNGKEAYEKYKELHPDVVVMDLAMPVMSGEEATKKILETDPDAKVLIFTFNAEAIVTSRMFGIGARGYITKYNASRDLVDAIRSVADGQIYFSDDVARLLADQKIKKEEDPLVVLSKRELEVFLLACQGLVAADIGLKLDVSSTTVNGHMARIKQKLNITTIAEMVRLAIRAGLLKP